MAVKERAAYTMAEACEQIGGVSRQHLYALVARGELAVVKVGRRTLVPASEIERLTTPPVEEGSPSG